MDPMSQPGHLNLHENERNRSAQLQHTEIYFQYVSSSIYNLKQMLDQIFEPFDNQGVCCHNYDYIMEEFRKTSRYQEFLEQRNAEDEQLSTIHGTIMNQEIEENLDYLEYYEQSSNNNESKPLTKEKERCEKDVSRVSMEDAQVSLQQELGVDLDAFLEPFPERNSCCRSNMPRILIRTETNDLCNHNHEPRERVIDMSSEDQKKWEMEEMQKSIDLEKANVHIDPSPFQLVERTSVLKVHSLFSMVGINHAYMTKIGGLVGVVGLKELRKAIEDINSNSFVVQVQLKDNGDSAEDVAKTNGSKPL
uniref:CBS domain-containing protein n=1 Tax=Glossina brevipalpis TaxID=37001 RepID=A0A1A9WM74_9MUSC